MITREMVFEQLKTVMDPELHVNIVDLGLIYNVGIQLTANSDQQIKVTMTLTTPGCPLAPVIEKLITEALVSLPGVAKEQVELELVWEPAWTKERMSDEVKLQLGMI